MKQTRPVLPSDSLTTAQRRALNGEVKTYRMNGPMAYKEFMALPLDLRKRYIENLRNKYGVTIGDLADMLGTTYSNACAEIHRLGIMFRQGFRKSQSQHDAWVAFLCANHQKEKK